MRISIKPEDNKPYETDSLYKEKIPFKELDFRQKLTYIWDYYKWQIGAALIVLTLAAIIIPSVIENRKETVLYTVMLNSNLKGQEYTSLMDDFTEAADIDMSGKKITLDCSMYIDRNFGDAGSMQNSQKLTALFASKTVDAMISDNDNFQFYAAQGCFYDLKELLPAEVYEKYADYFVEAKITGTDNTAVYGINLKDSAVLKKENAYEKKTEPILSICVTSEQTDNAAAFLEYLLSGL